MKNTAVGVVVLLCLFASGCGGSEQAEPAGLRDKLMKTSDAGASLIQFKDLIAVVNLSDKRHFEIVDWRDVSQGLFTSNKLVKNEFAVFYLEGEKRTLLCSLGFTREVSMQEIGRMIAGDNIDDSNEKIFVGFFGVKHGQSPNDAAPLPPPPK